MDFSAVIDILVSQEFARALIVAFFAAAICGIWLKPLPLRAIANSAPTILTSLGIFYTFLGILIALQDFDPNKPNTSMPELLKGLKLAFESSAWGLGLALGFRLVQAVGARESTAAPASAEALHSELRALNRNTLSVLEVLGGGEGASLCSQLKQLRNESKGYAEKADTAAENEEKALQGLDEKLGMLHGNALLVRQALTGEGDASLYAQLERLRSEFGGFAEKADTAAGNEEKALQGLDEELGMLNKNTLLVRQALTEEGDASLYAQLERLRSEFGDFAEKVAQDGAEALQGLDEELGMLNKNTLLVRQALTGEGDASLYAQLERLRSEFGDFAEKVAQDGAEALQGLDEELGMLNKNTLLVRQALTGEGDASLYAQLERLRSEFGDFAEKVAQDGAEALQGLDEELGMLNKNTLLVRQALTGEGDASLYAQLERLRSEFGDFAEKVAQNGTEALVEALSGVILDFNEKISEQFGDNFKQLNDAVGRLLDWQKEYTQQMEQLKKAFEENQESIHKVRISVEAIEKATGEIPEYISTLGVAFNNVHNHAEQLEQSFEALSDMREAAKKAIPSMEGVIQTMGNDLVAITEKFVEIYNKFEQAIATFSSRLIELEEQMMRRLDQDGREP